MKVQKSLHYLCACRLGVGTNTGSEVFTVVLAVQACSMLCSRVLLTNMHTNMHTGLMHVHRVANTHQQRV